MTEDNDLQNFEIDDSCQACDNAPKFENKPKNVNIDRFCDSIYKVGINFYLNFMRGIIQVQV